MFSAKNNRQIEELYKQPKIITVIEAQRIRYFGHIERMGKEQIRKKSMAR